MALYVDCPQTTFLSPNKIHRHNTGTVNNTLQTATGFISILPEVLVCDVIVLRFMFYVLRDVVIDDDITWLVDGRIHIIFNFRKKCVIH